MLEGKIRYLSLACMGKEYNQENKEEWKLGNKL
jgi:hypothetical protein